MNKEVIIEKIFEPEYAQKYYESYIFRTGDFVSFEQTHDGLDRGMVVSYDYVSGFFYVSTYGAKILRFYRQQLKLML